jgi:monoamine oxidase
MTKVIVVGAGLAGLCAAVRLADAGCEVEVLEGRDEIGGRSRSRLVDGIVIELGGQFLSRPHRRMRELVADAGLHLRRTWLSAGIVRFRRDNAVNGRFVSVAALHDIRAFVRVASGSKSLATVRAAASDDQGAGVQDARSVREWLDAIGLHGPLRPAAETLIGQGFGGADPGEMSLLALAELIGGEGNGFLFLLDGFGLTDYVVEGVGAVCAHLAERLPMVRMNTAVAAVEHDTSGVAVRTVGGEVVEGDHVLMAVPAPVLDMIEFAPQLPQSIRGANKAIRYGQATKVAAVVKRRRMLRTTGFIGGSAVRQGWRAGNVLYGFADPDATAADISPLIADLCDGFGVNPLDVAHAELVPWSIRDPFSRGTYGHFLSGRFDGFRRSLPHYTGRLYLAGSERSARPGFMEGAVESGEAAANAILGVA